MIKGIVIDPKTRTIRYTEIETYMPSAEMCAGLQPTRDSLKTLIGTGRWDVFPISDRDSCFVDDEGLLKHPRDFFQINGSSPLAGVGVILGFDFATDTYFDTTRTIEDVEVMVTWSRRIVHGFNAKTTERGIDVTVEAPIVDTGEAGR